MIIYGSLYPWHFVARSLPASPLWILLHSWNGSLDRRFLADVIVNVALYAPLGMAAYLAFAGCRSKSFRLASPVFLGAIVSAPVEMAQIFTPSRNCSALDLIDNVVGSAAGVALGVLFERLARPVRFRVPDRGALLLLFVWVGSLLFPLFPVLSLLALRQKWLALAGSPRSGLLNALTYAASWIAAGFLIKATGIKPGRVWLVLSLLLIPAQFFVILREPLPAAFAGALVGTVVFCLAETSRVAVPALAWSFLLLLIARGLTPFGFHADPRPFLWTPFSGLLETNWQSGTSVLLEKVFYYGTSVWLLRVATKRWWLAASVTCVILAGIEVIQRWLPGRTPELTDPLIGLCTATFLWVLEPEPVAPGHGL